MNAKSCFWSILLVAVASAPAHAEEYSSTQIRRNLRSEPVRLFMGSAAVHETVSVELDRQNKIFKIVYIPGAGSPAVEKNFAQADLDKAPLVCPGDSAESDARYFSEKAEGVSDALWLTSLTRMNPLATEEMKKSDEGKKLTKITFAMAAGLLQFWNGNEGWSNVTLVREYESAQGKEKVMSNIGEWDLASFIPFETKSCNCQRDETKCN